MKYLTILPYLGLNDEISLRRGFKIWNFHKHKNKYINDPTDRALAEKLVNMFEKSEWVNVISKNNQVFVRRKGQTIQEIELLLFITSIGMGNVRSSIAKNDDACSSSEHFSFNEFPLDLALESSFHFKGDFLRCLTKPTIIPIQRGAIRKVPIIADRTNQNSKLDMKLLSALNKLQKHNKKLSEKIFRSLEMLFLTVSNNPLIPQLIHIILAVSAFENLLGKGKVNVKNKIDQIFKGTSLHQSKYEDNGNIRIEEKTPLRTSYAIWYEHLCRTRNRVVHGDELLPKHYKYHNQRHRYIAQLIYVQCLKYILNKELGTKLSGSVKRVNHNGKRWFEYAE